MNPQPARTFRRLALASLKLGSDEVRLPGPTNRNGYPHP
jgi:hypothetical protein